LGKRSAGKALESGKVKLKVPLKENRAGNHSSGRFKAATVMGKGYRSSKKGRKDVVGKNRMKKGRSLKKKEGGKGEGESKRDSFPP